MIPVLFEKQTSDFSTNGLGGLPDAISCIVTEERNGDYYLEMEYPENGLHASDIGVDRIIFAAPAPDKPPQPFVIERLQGNIDGVWEIYAPHISRLLSKRSTNVKAVNNVSAKQSAVTMIRRVLNNSTPANTSFPTFTAETHMNNATNTVNIDGVVLPALDCLHGVRGSVLDTFGGEYEWDVFNIILRIARGKETGIELRYGFNVSDLDAEIDAENIVTGVVPFWVNEDNYVIGSVCYADNKTDYDGSFQRIAPLDVTETLGTETTPTQADVTSAGESYISGSSLSHLSTSIEVGTTPVLLPEFTTTPPARRDVYICDTVTVVHTGIGIKQKSKIVKCVYNVLTEQYNSITVGAIRRDISDTIAGLIRSGSSGGSYVSSGGGSAESPVTSVNGKIGAVILTASDVGALPSSTFIPTRTSQLINDSGFLTAHQDVSGKVNRSELGDVAFSNDYDDLDNKPTKLSEFSNDADYQTSAQVQAAIAEIDNISELSPLISTDNLIQYHYREQASGDKITGGGFIFSLNETTGNVTITENRDPSVAGYLYCRCTYGFGSYSLRPPAGIYRLELQSTEPVDFSGVTGRLWIDNGSTILVTNENGRTIDIYLDESNQVVVNVNAKASLRTYIEGETTQPDPFTATVKPVFRRVGLPEIAIDQATDNNVLELEARYQNIDTQLMTFSKSGNESFTIVGVNTTSSDAIFYTSHGSFSANTSLKPPPGVYRYEITPHSDFFGRLYYGDANTFVETDATGKTIEIYLDGNMMVSSSVIVEPGGGSSSGVEVTVGLRRIGTPELGELLVDQMNQMRGLQRKTLSMLATLTKAYKSSTKYYDEIVDLFKAGAYDIRMVSDVTGKDDLNSLRTISDYNLKLVVVGYYTSRSGEAPDYTYDGTKNTPTSEGLTSYGYGVVLHFHNIRSGGDYRGAELALVAGGKDVYFRRWMTDSGGVVNVDNWVSIGGVS